MGCELTRLADIRVAAAGVRDLLGSVTVRPLRALVANTGIPR
ncbi:hypothetical protein [Umezawaea sp. Da 62-37]|nr:hypothetical protein [Umezawaea sp. Da 62-37]WNV88116.1 hypothetical protein RM788_07450 [Umezawaea sp. Da 62-37]